MLTVYSPKHVLHSPQTELHRGQVIPYHESVRRAELIIDAVKAAHLGDIVEPSEFGLAPLRSVHGDEYLAFLQSVYQEWLDSNQKGDAIPHVWIGRSLRTILPNSIFGRLGYFSYDASTPFTAGTWQAALASAEVALTAAERLQGNHRAVFGLTRPPGHHAAADVCGGYCFLNNAAIAAQSLIHAGADRVAIVDVDYHHGNGTQSIFYDRRDVLFVSLHANPTNAYPYFLGYADEQGSGPGQGYNVNIPLPEGTNWSQYDQALQSALKRVEDFAPDSIVISLGVDTFESDPICNFKLKSEDFRKMGDRIAALRLPTVLLMEGGYAVDSLGTNVINVLSAFC